MNLSLEIGQVQQQHGHHGHRVGGTSRQRRKERRAAARQAAGADIASKESDENAKAERRAFEEVPIRYHLKKFK